MATRLEAEFGMPNSSDILTAGRLIINGFHEKAAYEEAEERLSQGIVPFYPGPIDPIHRRVRDGDICLTKKGVISYLGEVSSSAGYRQDGYPGTEHATGFSLLNGQGKGPQVGTDGKPGEKGDEWHEMVLRYKMAGIADQSAVFDQKGYDDDVDLTFQRRGLKTIRNVGPHTLHKGKKWLWEIPRNAEHARDIKNSMPRQDDTPIERHTPYPREYDPKYDQVNTYLMHKILVEKSNPSRLSMLYDTIEPIHNAIASFDEHLRMIFALKELSDFYADEGETTDPESIVNRAAAEWNDNYEAQNKELGEIMAKYGLKEAKTEEEIRERRSGAKKWDFFRYLLYASEEGEHAMIAKLPQNSTTMKQGPLQLRKLQENSISGLLGAIADGNHFAASRIGGTIENDAEPGQDFDTLLESN